MSLLSSSFLQTHAIMGTNGSGKSTLSKCLVGHPDYEVTSGSGTSKFLSPRGVGAPACHRHVCEKAAHNSVEVGSLCSDIQRAGPAQLGTRRKGESRSLHEVS